MRVQNGQVANSFASPSKHTVKLIHDYVTTCTGQFDNQPTISHMSHGHFFLTLVNFLRLYGHGAVCWCADCQGDGSVHNLIYRRLVRSALEGMACTFCFSSVISVPSLSDSSLSSFMISWPFPTPAALRFVFSKIEMNTGELPWHTLSVV